MRETCGHLLVMVVVVVMEAISPLCHDAMYGFNGQPLYMYTRGLLYAVFCSLLPPACRRTLRRIFGIKQGRRKMGLARHTCTPQHVLVQEHCATRSTS